MAAGWKLDRDERATLLARFIPAWPEAVADHVTLASGGISTEPWQTLRAEIVGQANDGEGVQAMVVAIDGITNRPDGGTYHITWSLDRARGRRAVESNTVIAQHGWQRIDPPVAIRLSPARWD